MDQAGTQTVATFTGTLLKRQHTPGKPFAQLIFREANEDWLCLTSNLAHAAKLQVGRAYRIEGLFKSLGQHQYIHEPNIMPLARQIKKRRWWIAVTVVIIMLLTAGGIVFATAHQDKPTTPPTTSESTTPQTSSPDTSTAPTTASPSTTTTPSADTTTTTPTTTPPTTTKTTPKTTTPPANNNNSNSVVTPVPYCDADVITPFGYQTVQDPTQPTTYSAVTTPGVNGDTRTCYPGQGQPGQTTVIATEQDQVTTVGAQDPNSGP
ncbi:MAG TPA: hypothetical protein VLE99_04225 [Candidatus Saccharimonadales bacterium]|nr:hypothetical protein [Candidatus Saccharimonadales bacterium]